MARPSRLPARPTPKIWRSRRKEAKRRGIEESRRAASPSPSLDNRNEKAVSCAKTSGQRKQAADAAVQKAETEAEHESDVQVITRAVYREDNEGYLDPKHPQHIWTVPAPRSADRKSDSRNNSPSAVSMRQRDLVERRLPASISRRSMSTNPITNFQRPSFIRCLAAAVRRPN